jgi:hypothetical protein
VADSRSYGARHRCLKIASWLAAGPHRERILTPWPRTAESPAQGSPAETCRVPQRIKISSIVPGLWHLTDSDARRVWASADGPTSCSAAADVHWDTLLTPQIGGSPRMLGGVEPGFGGS